MEHVVEETQYCVALEHKPGKLTALCKALRHEGVNIEALFVSNDAEVAWVNFLASPMEKVENTLEGAGYKFLQERVLTVEAANRPGEIEDLSSRLAEHGVNINYIYGSGTAGTPSKIILSVDDMIKARSALERR